MKHTSFFLITPKTELVDRIVKSGQQELVDLVSPVIWSGNEYDRGILTQSDMESLVKLLYVDSVLRERASASSFGSVLGAIAVSESDFDKNWTLTRIRLDMLVNEAVSDSIETGSMPALMAASNDRVRDFLQKFQQEN